MRDVVKIMVKPLIATLAEKDITLKFQPSALKYLSEAGYDQKWVLVHFAVLFKIKSKINYLNLSYQVIWQVEILLKLVFQKNNSNLILHNK